MRAFNAELSKLFSLPGIWLAFLIGAFAPAVIAALDSTAQKEKIIAGVSTRLSWCARCHYSWCACCQQ
ncbi:hypothetical protein [Cytobacillus purgationiresistens]|uniref:hypothetical protein n=1 Tax=Cytobacillus purgationiresistens TaxID=863449 RepID=UPI0027D92CAE|nr:hypothetical protein [Cytobacillus purgationiresistens]